MSERELSLSNPSQPEVFRQKIEGMWSAIPISSEGQTIAGWGPFEEELTELTEYMQLYILQDEEIPYRFIAQYKRLDIEGEMDFRVMPGGLESTSSVTAMFTFIEDDELDMMAGSGFAKFESEDILTGIMMLHMGDDFPFRWQRVSTEIPDDIRETILDGQWFDDEVEQEEELPSIDLLGGFNDLLGGLFDLGDVEIIMEDEEEEIDGNGTEAHEAAIQKTIEEFLLYQDELIEALAKGGIRSVAPLLAATDEELLSIQGIETLELQEIRRVMQAWGLTLRTAEDYTADDAMLQCVYRFRVTLDRMPDIWREIELVGGHTLHDFHTTIQEAFNWDDEHLYAFYMSGKFWDASSAIEHPFAKGEVSASDVLLAGLGLQPKQNFVYLFDFGDEWRHRIELLSITEPGGGALAESPSPVITQFHGDAPEQYAELDEEQLEEYN